LKDYENLESHGLKLDELAVYKNEDEDNIDLLIIVGGDGTLLWALQYFTHRIPPPILAFSNVT
jgi:NAD kinase